MAEREHDTKIEARPVGVNPGYAAFQIAKALTATEEHDDPATRDRAREKIVKWQSVLGNILSAQVAGLPDNADVDGFYRAILGHSVSTI